MIQPAQVIFGIAVNTYLQDLSNVRVIFQLVTWCERTFEVETNCTGTRCNCNTSHDDIV